MKKASDLEKIKDYIKMVDSTSSEKNSLGNYNTAVLVCIDAVLSINRQYYKFVVPRITYFQNNYSDIITLNQLLNLIEKKGIEGFSECWNYKHNSRVETLYYLVKKLIDISKKYYGNTELECLRNWAKLSMPSDYKNFNVKGVGLATYQYIRMMLGASTVKPDIHIKRTISNILNRNISDMDAIDLFENACRDLKLDIAVIDHNLWLSLANNKDNFSMAWKEDKWVEEEEIVCQNSK